MELLEDIMDIGGGLLILAIIFGPVILPLFYNVDTSTWTPVQSMVWGSIIVVALSVLIMMAVRKIRKYK